MIASLWTMLSPRSSGSHLAPLDDLRQDRRIALGFALAMMVLSLWCHNAPGNPNSLTRVALADAMLARHNLTIDEIAPLAEDKARHGGHFYSDKAPGIALLSLPAAAAAECVADRMGLAPGMVAAGRHLSPRYALVYFACLATAAAIAAAGLTVFFLALRGSGVERRGAFAMTAFLGFGSQYLFWSTALFGHAAAAALLFCGYAAGRDGHRAPLLVAAGLLLGLAGLVEFPAGPAAMMVGATIVFAHTDQTARLRTSALLATGAAGPMLALAGYNALAFGSPFALGYASVTGFAAMRTGFFGITIPDPMVILRIVFGPYRGIVWLSPVLALGVAGAIRSLAKPRLRPAALLALAITAYYLALNGGYHYWDGGYSTGPRHLTPALPFVLFALGERWNAMMPRQRGAVLVLGLAGIAISLTCALYEVVAPDDGMPMLAHVAAAIDPRTPLWIVPFAALAAVAWAMRDAAPADWKPARASPA